MCSVPVGCSDANQPTVVPVSGQVMVNAKPATNAIITFADTDQGFAAAATIAEDGSYQIRSQYGNGVPPGEYLVSVSPPSTRDELDQTIPLPPGTATIPQKYHSSQTSKLKAEVKEGESTFDFNLD
ncbi:carboxypeptidase-like regulatory domain-containing protein [Gimesia sp.]|uniref:carboxypeptidase-like regulatory domain-containing protein n=1 Tax=Gimesia sp. TaxID=2024833 RepID=UPI003A8E74EE